MKKTLKFAIPAVLAVVLLAGDPARTGHQSEPTRRVYLMQNGVRVGEVFSPLRSPDQTQYVEDWVLYANSLEPGQPMAMQPAPDRPFAGESDFFRRVPFPSGARYVRRTVREYTALPVPRDSR